MNSIDSEFEEIKEFDKSISGKSSNEIREILDKKSTILITQLYNQKPISVCIKFNGYLKVVDYKKFEKNFPIFTNIEKLNNLVRNIKLFFYVR